MTEVSTPAAEHACANCGAPAPGKYCPECGQATARRLHTVAEFLRDAVARYATRDGALWQTLAKLLFAPGALTVEYAAGRRTRYLRPLQIYLAASVLVFAVAQIYGLNVSLRLFGDHGIHLVRGTPLPVGNEGGIGSKLSPVQLIVDHVDTAKVRRFASLSTEGKFNFLRSWRVQYISSFILFMVPVFALIVMIAYRNRRRRYAEHLIFGLHVHSFLLLVLLVETALPSLLANALSLWALAYVVLAFKRVYGGRWAPTLGRSALAGAMYLASYFAGNFLLILALVEW